MTHRKGHKGRKKGYTLGAGGQPVVCGDCGHDRFEEVTVRHPIYGPEVNDRCIFCGSYDLREADGSRY